MKSEADVLNSIASPAASQPLARDAAHRVPYSGGSSVEGYGSAQQRALQLLREKQPRPLRRQSVPVPMRPRGEPPLPHIDKYGANRAKPPSIYIHPSLKGKPPPPAGKPSTPQLVDRGRRKSTGDLGARLNISGTLRPPPPRGPPPPIAKPIAPIVGSVGSTLQSVHEDARRRSSDFRRPPPGLPPSERRLSAVALSNPPHVPPTSSKPSSDGHVREEEQQRNPSITTMNEEASAVRRISFSSFQGPPSSESAIDGSVKGVNAHRQSTSGEGQTAYIQGDPSGQALVKPTSRPLPQLPKRRPSAEPVGGPGKPPPPRPVGEPPAGQTRRYSISHELCEGVGDFSRSAGMLSIFKGSADADAGPGLSITKSDDQVRRLSSDRASGVPMDKEGGEQPSSPQALPGGRATILWYNMGVTRQKELDVKGAVECYQRAVENGHSKAQHNLAAIYEKGAPDVPKDDVEAVRLFRLAADQGLAESCYSLAMHLKFGLGVGQDDAQCVYYLEKASEYGLAKAMFNLGLMYEKRRGVSLDALEVDLLEATRECYEAAAEAGVTKAMVNMGVLCLSGRLHGHQPKEALEWFKKAGGDGDVSGLWNLSLCYERGVGVPQDKLAAQALQQQCREREREDRQKHVVPAIAADEATNRAPPGRRASEPSTPAPVRMDESIDSSAASGRGLESRRRSSSVPFITPPPPKGAPPTDKKQHDRCHETSAQVLELKGKIPRGPNTGYIHIPSGDRPADMRRTVTANSGQTENPGVSATDPGAVLRTIPDKSDSVADGGREHRKVEWAEDADLTLPQARGRKDSLLLKPTPLAIARVKAAVERRKTLEAAVVAATAFESNSRPK